MAGDRVRSQIRQPGAEAACFTGGYFPEYTREGFEAAFKKRFKIHEAVQCPRIGTGVVFDGRHLTYLWYFRQLFCSRDGI